MSMAVYSESQVVYMRLTWIPKAQPFYSEADLENSEMGGRDTFPLASYLDAFYFLRII